MVYLAFRNLEGQVAMKHKRNERGQSILLFAILMPLMSLFLLGILDYMVTNARVMETVAAADLAAHAGAQEITVLPDGTITATTGGMALPPCISTPNDRAIHNSSRYPAADIREGLPVLLQPKPAPQDIYYLPAG